MLIRFTAFIAFCSLSASAYAENCKLNNLDFGISQEKLKSIFAIDSLAIATTGEGRIVSGTDEICKELPEGGVVEFMLIDDKFVQMKIKSNNSTGALFTFAKKIFGEIDNKEKDLTKVKQENKIKLGLWTKNDNYGVIYTTYTAGKNNFEDLSITSKQHAELFSTANKAKSQDIDDYMKENKLGIYSPSYKKNDNKDKIQDIQDAYKKQEKNKSKILKENENDRGYHYENK